MTVGRKIGGVALAALFALSTVGSAAQGHTSKPFSGAKRSFASPSGSGPGIGGSILSSSKGLGVGGCVADVDGISMAGVGVPSSIGAGPDLGAPPPNGDVGMGSLNGLLSGSGCCCKTTRRTCGSKCEGRLAEVVVSVTFAVRRAGDSRSCRRARS